MTLSADLSDIENDVSMTARHVGRLYALPDRFLARELLSTARETRASLGIEPSDSYDGILLWNVIPQVCRALGETEFSLQEKSSMGPQLSGQDLRSQTGLCLENSRVSLSIGDHANAYIFNDLANGCPIAFAVDRVAPPDATTSDTLARRIREVCRARFGDERYSSWCPEFQDYPGRNKLLAAFKARVPDHRFVADEHSLAREDVDGIERALGEFVKFREHSLGNPLCGPEGDADSVVIDPIFAKQWSEVGSPLRWEIVEACRQAGVSEIESEVTPVLTLEGQADRVACYDLEDLNIDRTGIVALYHSDDRIYPELVGALVESDLVVQPEWREKGIGTGIIIAAMAAQGGLPTWEHEKPGYSSEGASVAKRAVDLSLDFIARRGPAPQPELEM